MAVGPTIIVFIVKETVWQRAALVSSTKFLLLKKQYGSWQFCAETLLRDKSRGEKVHSVSLFLKHDFYNAHTFWLSL